jgi:cytosine/uracil/thiamine/allantoin permease
MEILISVFWVVFLMLIWFESDAFVRYTDLLGIDEAFYLHEYHVHKDQSLEPLDYLDFIRQHDQKSFWVALFSCQTCLSFWGSLLVSCIVTSAYFLPVVYVLSLCLYLFIKKYLIK